MHWMVASFYILLQFVDKSMNLCTVISYNDNTNISLRWDIDDNQMKRCIQQIQQNTNSKEKHIVFDDRNNHITQFFYVFENSFASKNITCFTNNATDEIYNITISCMNFTEASAALDDRMEYYSWNSSMISSYYANYTSTTMKPLPEKWIRIVRVGLASFSVFLAIITVCVILFLFVVLLKCIQRLLLVRRMPTSQYSIIKHIITDEAIEDVTQESSCHNSAVYYRQKISASRLLHLKDIRFGI
ncbi:Uncharacterized protein BM_BM17715 [Brugia malayi]|uniref:Uncharacterized protein n=1 Tax=Brugia malayi TaxID=6279 RepID=A0A4E9FLN4_BRUMA|nr:Uncharacterized protein BM_BM17715 [Brugia malayi]VIO97647.1 Uncharacterized protein BM_BM17715 [Brugia malayi]